MTNTRLCKARTGTTTTMMMMMVLAGIFCFCQTGPMIDGWLVGRSMGLQEGFRQGPGRVKCSACALLCVNMLFAVVLLCAAVTVCARLLVAWGEEGGYLLLF